LKKDKKKKDEKGGFLMKKLVIVGLSCLVCSIFFIGAPCGGGEPTALDVTLTVSIADGNTDANCDVIDPYKWATKGVGKSMYITGAIATGYETEDPNGTVSAALGNWTPNSIALNKVGTDKYQITIPAVPVNAHIAYKYTWGNAGDTWTGTEEFPGNSRILQVVDSNGDKKFSRFDKFADETTNKDASNLNNCGNGTVDYTTDINKDCGADGYPDVQETFETQTNYNWYTCP
jgi:hypothetical protein